MLKMSVIICFLTILISCSGTSKDAINKNTTFPAITTNSVPYKSDETNELKLNYHNKTYSYKEQYYPKTGEDVGYRLDSRGKFSVKNDTITFLSDMPSEIKTEDNWSTTTEYLPLYSTDELIDDNSVKIYFDNIAEPKNYKAYEFKNGNFEKLKIKEYKEEENTRWIKKNGEDIPLFKYLLIEKPVSNKLLILNNENQVSSFFFDLEKIPYCSFHFYTRAYWSYYDFTGLKFVISGDKLKLIEDNRLKRFQNSVISKVFLKQ